MDDCSTNEETLNTLKEYEEKDERIHVKYRKKNGHISKASNDALKMAKGEFIALVDNDDTLDCHALYEVVKVLNQNKELDFIYSDEDKLDLKGERCDPNFKPDWSPDTLLSLNYICHLSVLRKSMLPRKDGTIINISSIWGMVGASLEVAYSTTKAAIIGMSKALAKELAPSNITVNVVAPGAISTDMLSTLSDDDMRVLKDEIPLGKIGAVEDVAASVKFLASYEARYITGQVISPNGGLVI